MSDVEPTIVLILWVHDEVVKGNIVKIHDIKTPRVRPSEYKVGDFVSAKLSGFGTPEGRIVKIGCKFIVLV
jgi:hypothetical protein